MSDGSPEEPEARRRRCLTPTTWCSTCATSAPATSRCGTGIAFRRTAFSITTISFRMRSTELARQIGYRVRPSWVWTYEEGGYPGLIVGFVNDGIAGVPGVLRVSGERADGKVIVGGSLDAGYPLPGKVRQAKFPLPKGTNWKGLRLKRKSKSRDNDIRCAGLAGRS